MSSNSTYETTHTADAIRALEQRIASLEAELAARDEARPPPRRTESTDLPTDDDGGAPDRSGRREFVRRFGLVAGAAVAGAAATTTAASPAAASNGDPVLIGALNQQDNNAATTEVVYNNASSDLNDDIFRATAAGTSSSGYRGAIAGYGGAKGVEDGVLGVSDGLAGSGVHAIGSGSNATGLRVVGNRAHMRLQPLGNPGPDRTGFRDTGEVAMDQNGTLWICVVQGTSPTWLRLAGPDTTGALTMHDVPKRVYDSRVGDEVWGFPQGILGEGDQIDINCQAYNAVAPGATAALMNVTVTNTSTAGFLKLWKTGAAQPPTSNINWSAAGSNVANGMTVALDATGSCTIRCDGVGAATDVILDVVGYYR